MKKTVLLAGAMAALTLAVPIAAHAAPAEGTPAPAPSGEGGFVASRGDGIPDQLDADQRAGYRAVFANIHAGKWADAQLQLAAMKPGPLHAIAQAELYTGKGSPKADADALAKLVADAPELPQAAQLVRLARSRGASITTPLPEAQTLTWVNGAPSRVRAKPTRQDAVATELALKMQPFVKVDDGAGAQGLFEATTGLSSDATTEWQQRIGWIYFLSGDDKNAHLMAAKAEHGFGEWAVQGWWVDGLAAWRQKDYAAAGTAFEAVAARATDIELRAAALFWAARAEVAGAQPAKVEAHLKAAAQYDETFYGLLARQALGIRGKARATESYVADDWRALSLRPNVRVAAALVEVGEDGLADEVIRQQARIGDPSEFSGLVRLTSKLNLAGTLVWLSHNMPVGAQAGVAARYPAPNWVPDGGWRVDKALVYAHTLQESRFRTDVVSHAGAFGLMQIMPSAASDIGRARGIKADRSALTRPSTNMEIGQTYLERLRDQPCTGGLLPKVIAAYNAGPVPVDAWNAQSRDGGDPLLYIESIPYWETRGYVTTVLRNYWMYESEAGKAASPSRAALAQGMWPRFPGLSGQAAVRIRTAVAPPMPGHVMLAPSAVPQTNSAITMAASAD